MLLNDDRNPDADPIAHQGQEVREDLGQMCAAGDGADGIYDERDCVPNEARHHFKVPAQSLPVDAACVSGSHDVRDQPQSHDDAAE